MPNLPIHNPHPAMTNPAQVRYLSTLHVGGGWDAVPLEIPCAGMRWAMFYFTYRRGAAGGAFDIMFECSPYATDQALVENWFENYAFDNGTITEGQDVGSNIQRALVTYGSVDGEVQNIYWGPHELQGTVERIRARFRESGVVGTPGSLHVVALFYE